MSTLYAQTHIALPLNKREAKKLAQGEDVEQVYIARGTKLTRAHLKRLGQVVLVHDEETGREGPHPDGITHLIALEDTGAISEDVPEPRAFHPVPDPSTADVRSSDTITAQDETA